MKMTMTRSSRQIRASFRESSARRRALAFLFGAIFVVPLFPVMSMFDHTSEVIECRHYGELYTERLPGMQISAQRRRRFLFKFVSALHTFQAQQCHYPVTYLHLVRFSTLLVAFARFFISQPCKNQIKFYSLRLSQVPPMRRPHLTSLVYSNFNTKPIAAQVQCAHAKRAVFRKNYVRCFTGVTIENIT